MTSKILTLEGSQIFIDRVGIKSIGQIKNQLERINLSNELPVYLSKLLDEHNNHEDIVRVMTWSVSDNISEFDNSLIKI